MSLRPPKVLLTVFCLVVSPAFAQMPDVSGDSNQNPDQLPTLMSLGRILAFRGRPAEAGVKFREAVRLFPTNAEANLELGANRMMSGQTNEAAKYFSAALQLEPELAEKNWRAAKTLIVKNQRDSAIRRLMLICWLKPEDAEAHEILMGVCWNLGRFGDALAQFEETLRLRPDALEETLRVPVGADDVTFYIRLDANFDNKIALMLTSRGKFEEAIRVYREAVRLYPNDPMAWNNLAWNLVAIPKPELRNGKEAVQFATKAVELTGHQQPIFIGTLAAAYAETGQFPKAVETAKKARDLALLIGQQDVAARNEQLLRLYSAGKTVLDK